MFTATMIFQLLDEGKPKLDDKLFNYFREIPNASKILNHKDKPAYAKKMISLVVDTSLLGLVLGVLGAIIGLITAFDAIEGLDEMNAAAIAGGLKVSFLTMVFGTFVFIISRTGIFVINCLDASIRGI